VPQGPAAIVNGQKFYGGFSAEVENGKPVWFKAVLT
jgi:hypothetical protein